MNQIEAARLEQLHSLLRCFYEMCHQLTLSGSHPRISNRCFEFYFFLDKIFIAKDEDLAELYHAIVLVCEVEPDLGSMDIASSHFESLSGIQSSVEGEIISTNNCWEGLTLEPSRDFNASRVSTIIVFGRSVRKGCQFNNFPIEVNVNPRVFTFALVPLVPCLVSS